MQFDFRFGLCSSLSMSAKLSFVTLPQVVVGGASTACTQHSARVSTGAVRTRWRL